MRKGKSKKRSKRRGSEWTRGERGAPAPHGEHSIRLRWQHTGWVRVSREPRHPHPRQRSPVACADCWQAPVLESLTERSRSSSHWTAPEHPGTRTWHLSQQRHILYRQPQWQLLHIRQSSSLPGSKWYLLTVGLTTTVCIILASWPSTSEFSCRITTRHILLYCTVCKSHTSWRPQ